MKRKIITDNASRTIKKKPRTDEQIKKAVEKYAVKPQVPFKIGTLISPGQALGDYLKKQAEQVDSEFQKDLVSAYAAAKQSFIPKSFLGGQAIATSDYKAWKPGNTPTSEDIKAMLQLLGQPGPNMPSMFLTDEKTAQQLKTHFGAQVAKDLADQHLPGLKVHVVPGMKPGTIIGMDMAKVGGDFTAQMMGEWKPMSPEEYKESRKSNKEKK
jgi:hypothetical protein